MVLWGFVDIATFSANGFVSQNARWLMWQLIYQPKYASILEHG